METPATFGFPQGRSDYEPRTWSPAGLRGARFQAVFVRQQAAVASSAHSRSSSEEGTNGVKYGTQFLPILGNLIESFKQTLLLTDAVGKVRESRLDLRYESDRRLQHLDDGFPESPLNNSDGEVTSATGTNVTARRVFS